MNNHDHWKELLALSLYPDELPDEQMRELDAHLSSCGECRAELGRLEALHARLKEAALPAAPDEGVLAEARLQLRGALRLERSRRPSGPLLAEAFRGFIRWWTGGHTRIALGAASGFALGIVAAALFLLPGAGRRLQGPAPGAGGGSGDSPASPAAMTGGFPADTRISNIRFLSTDMTTGEIEFAFDAVKSVRMKGNINNDRVQKILTHALLTEENAGVRLKSISAMASRKSADKEVKTTLITAMKTDENPGVRQEALKALQNYQMDQEIKQALLFVLTHEKNPALRIAAINTLDSAARAGGQSIDKEVLNVMREKMHNDDNQYIRLRARAVVGEVQQ